MILDTFFNTFRRALDMISFQRVFFIFFLFSLPFSIRKVLVIFSPNGVFNEYMDLSVSLSDVFLGMTLLFFILENKSLILSIEYWRRMFHVEHLLLPIFIPSFFILWSGLSLFWSESIFLALATLLRLIEGYFLYVYMLLSNVPRGTIGTKYAKCSTWNNFGVQYRVQRDKKMFHVEQFDQNTKNVPRGTFFICIFNFFGKCSTWNIWQVIFTVVIISAIFQSFIAILQFFWQKSLGLTFLGESIFSVSQAGVAKIVIDGNIFIRSYGFFPHPNVLGGFLALSLLITLVYPILFGIKMFHVEHSDQKQYNVPRGTFFSKIWSLVSKCSTWNIWTKNNTMFHVEHLRNLWLYRLILLIQLSALFLSFSKLALLSYILGIIVLILGIQRMFHVEHFDQKQYNVPRGTFSKSFFQYLKKCSTWNIPRHRTMETVKKMFHVEHLVIISGFFLLGMLLISLNLKLFFIQPLIERLFYLQSVNTFYKEYFFGGLGIGQYVFMMQQFFDKKLLLWEFQPIHNVFLLIFSELGIVGLSLFLWFFLYAFFKNDPNVPRGTIWGKISKCSTWNIWNKNKTMFHVEHLSQDTGRSELKSKGKVADAWIVPRGTILKYLCRSLLLVVGIIMLFDHYFWDIQQGQLFLWIILALSIASKRY